MNIPNKITITRIIMMPIFIALFLLDFPYSKFIALGIFILAAASDALDGYIARKYNLVTNLGKFLDPIADKLLATTGLIMLIVGSNPIIPMPYGVIVMFIMILRDYEVTGIRQIGQLKGKIIAADKVAKVKANFLYSTLVYGLLIAALREITVVADSEFFKYFNLVFLIFVGITTALIIVSGIVYFVNNFSVFKDEEVAVVSNQKTEVQPQVEEKKEEEKKSSTKKSTPKTTKSTKNTKASTTKKTTKK